VRQHLKPGGIFHLNTTGSADAYKTAFTIFPYGLRFINFATVSDSPIEPNEERWKRALDAHRTDGRATFDSTRAIDRERRAQVLALLGTLNAPPVSFGLEWRDSVLPHLGRAEMITDDNMLPEWRAPGEAIFPLRSHR
jgi:hypothetical protein